MADREADLGADLQELQANRLTLSASQGGLLQSETTQGVHELGGGAAQAFHQQPGHFGIGTLGSQLQIRLQVLHRLRNGITSCRWSE